MAEGIPFGFSSVTLATLMKQQGLNANDIGIFVATLYLPWSWKWLMAPLLDVISWHRTKHFQTWICIAQVAMLLSLLVALQVPIQTQWPLFNLLILIHNVFAALQDVAIDALACSVLKQDERGLVNGAMSAGANVGGIIGGSLSLYVFSFYGLWGALVVVLVPCLLITLLLSMRLSLWLQEPILECVPESLWWQQITHRLYQFIKQLWRVLKTDAQARYGFVFSLLPTGSYVLVLAIQTQLAVDLGFSTESIALLSMLCALVCAAGCFLGGIWSDRMGRYRVLLLFLLLSLVSPVLLWALFKYYHLEMVIKHHQVSIGLLVWLTFAGLSLFHQFIHGVLYSTRAAWLMDTTHPKLAATQFTAYMACLSFGLSYMSRLFGLSVTRYGYANTFLLDMLLGILCAVPLLLGMRTKRP